MSKRIDSTGFLYHWVKAEPHRGNVSEDYETAFETFISILSCGCIKNGDLFKTGNTPCICFTESPEYFMYRDRSKYQPFGFKFGKRYAYAIGGRTVIYASASEKKLLPFEMQWRYMLHDPTDQTESRPYGVDFTWEREWRIPSEEVDVTDSLRIIVPNQFYIQKVISITENWLEEGANYMYDHCGEFEAHPDLIKYVNFIRDMLSTPEEFS